MLLHSLSCFWNIIESLLNETKPTSICEIGVSTGGFAALLINYCNNNNATYTGIDPTVNTDFVAKYESTSTKFVQKPSLDALKTLPPADIYFVDGDHNYYTVLNELKLILAKGGQPVLFLHDTTWPWGRRDQYCSPESIPADFRHPHNNSGYVHPDYEDIQTKSPGFCGTESDYQYSAAEKENGPQNGVLTAVEDICNKTPDLSFMNIPTIFGLGILHYKGSINSDTEKYLTQGLSLFAPLLELTEKNRLQLFFQWSEQGKKTVDLIEKFNTIKNLFNQLTGQFNTLRDQFSEQSEYCNTQQKENNNLQTAYADLKQDHKNLKDAYEKTPSMYLKRIFTKDK